MVYDGFSIGQRLYKSRLNKGLSQTVLSEKAGISQSRLSDIENGNSPLPVDILIKLCDILEIAVTWVLGIEDDELTYEEKARLQEYKEFLISKRK